MTTKLNRCYWQATAAGTGAFTYSSGLTGFLNPTDAGAQDAIQYAYIAEVGSPAIEWELGIGTFTAAGGILSRDIIVKSSNANAVVNFSVTPNVRMGVALALDFGEFNRITTNNTTVATADINYPGTIVTTDGSGLVQTIELPYLDLPQVGLKHLIILPTLANPADILQVGGVGDRLGEGGYALFEWTYANGWMIVNGYPMTLNSPGRKLFARNAQGYSELIVPPMWHSTYNYVNVSHLSETFLGISAHTEYLTTDGSGSPSLVQLQHSGYYLRKLVAFADMANPGDIINFDNTFEMPDGSTPTTVSLNAGNDYLYVESRPNRGLWVIIEASAGVVVP